MISHLVSRMALSVALVLLLASAGVAQPPPPVYRVYMSGYYDRYPYPPPIGSSVIYSSGPPMISYVDPWGRVVDMPLRPKVLYGNTPFLTPEGFHYPTSIVVMPEPARRPVTYRVSPAVPVPKQTSEPPPLIPRAADLDALPPAPLPPPVRVPATELPPIPNAAGDQRPVRKPAIDLPPIPKLPELPKTPLPPGAPNLGPTPMEMPARKPG
jgi:hypothetical protein